MSLHLSRPVRRPAVVLLSGAVALTGLLAVGGGVASAHVTVSSADAAPGGYGKLTFRVPNESDVASTVALRIQVPTDTPLTSLRAQPVPGWTVSLTQAQLDPPAEVHGETVDQAVSVVEYRAEDGGGIAPGEFQEFALSGGPFPDTESLTFNAVQSYSDGSEAAWIEPTVDGQAEPAYPAPVLTLSGEGAGTNAHGSTDTAAGDTATDTASAESADDGTDGTAVTALVLAVLGLLAGLGGLFLGLTARRRTVSS
ncbi:YcnI family protein [uncultured Modestobacter sp.]|uniref:YcnI family copper-binding membrane protein n=1 Tax=uncultured Modestobacter sp. TaxID=380048 RepID=UPI002623997F|nr:YcnI family protein [uncultured Modestobacter sp.]